MNELSRGCPCLHTTPCHERCTCVMSLSSSGCSRCCSYGSAEQQAAMAARLSGLDDFARRMGDELYARMQQPGFEEALKRAFAAAPAEIGRAAVEAVHRPLHELREILDRTVEHASDLAAALDELAQLRAKERLRAAAVPPAGTDDLPPDVATGLYLDRPFDADDLEWIKMGWDAYRSRGDGVGGPPRPWQIMLVFQAIRRDERATAEFLRVMNTLVLPLLRRLRLKEHPHFAKLGAADQ